ncbi:MAG: hypothetical protein IPM92_14980 [Saprospiraceae bacterium]|nr:hypothetical protein [Saprospiraceae bacterium]
MEKNILFILAFSSLSCFVKAQNFDDFTVDKEVSIFIKDNFATLKNFDLGIKCPHEENQWYLDSLEYSPWYVGDFNKDNISDLFVTGKQRKDQTHYLIFGKDELDEQEGWEFLQLYPSKKRGDLVIPFIEETRKQLYIIFKQFKTSTTTVVKDGMEVRLPTTYKDYYKMGLMKKIPFCMHMDIFLNSTLNLIRESLNSCRYISFVNSVVVQILD